MGLNSMVPNNLKAKLTTGEHTYSRRGFTESLKNAQGSSIKDVRKEVEGKGV